MMPVAPGMRVTVSLTNVGNGRVLVSVMDEPYSGNRWMLDGYDFDGALTMLKTAGLLLPETEFALRQAGPPELGHHVGASAALWSKKPVAQFGFYPAQEFVQ